MLCYELLKTGGGLVELAEHLVALTTVSYYHHYHDCCIIIVVTL